MGLNLEVGMLADLRENDEEGFEYHRVALEQLSSFLVDRGLPAHHEPLDCEVWSGDMIGYSGLHDVRRIAAYLDAGKPLPSPSSKNSAQDPCLEAYYASVVRGSPSMLARLFGRSPRFRHQFDHLIVHSDAEGYYLPTDFDEVLFPPADLEVPGGMVGSAQRLLAELDRIANALEIPPTLSDSSEELWEAADSPVMTGKVWQRYGRESYGCVVLREGCRRAITSGAALVFT